MKKFGIAFLAFVLVLGGGLYALTFVDINAYRSDIAQLAEGQTGRKLELNGLLKIGYSLTPTIVATDVRFGNAAWGSDPFMFEADHVAMRLSLLGALSGSVDVQRLDVMGAQVLLETGPNGVGNWVLGNDADAPSDADATVSTHELPHIALEDVRVTYKSGRRGDTTEIFLSRADVEPRGEGIAVGLSGDVNAKTASASAVIFGDEQSFRVANLKLEYGNIGLTGQLTGDRKGANSPVTIDGDLSATAVNLDELKSADAGEPQQAGLFSREPLPFNALSVVNGEVTIAVESLTYEDLEFTDFQAGIELKDGSLSAPLFATYDDRRLEATISATNKDVPSSSVKLSAPGINIGRFLDEVGATDLIEVDGHIGLDLSSSGSSLADIAANLNGKIDVATGRGSIHSSAFEWIAKDLIWALIPKGGESGVADLTCFIGELDFKSGVGDVAALALVTSKIRTSGSGEVDLHNETVDIRLNPKPNDPGLLSLATPVNVTGPLSSPSVAPDTGALLGDLAVAVGAGVLTGGIGAVLPLVSAEHFDAETAGACLEVLGAPKEAKPDTGGNVLDDVGEGAGSVIKGVGDVLTSPFD